MSGAAAGAASGPGVAPSSIRTDLTELTRLAGPVVASRLGVMAMGMTDTIVVGRYSAEQLGYHAMAWAVTTTVLASALGLLSGVQVMASRAIGEGAPREAGAALRRGLVYGLWIGLAAAIVLAGGGPWLLGALGLKRAFLAVATLAYILRMREARELGVFDKPPRDRAREAEQRRIGYGAGASAFFEVAAFSGMNVVAGWISALVVAAWAVVLNVAALIFMVPWGLATATAVLVARGYGANDPRAVRRAALLGFAVTALFGLLAAASLWPAAPWVARLYTADVATIALATAALVLSCLFLAPDAMQVVVAQALRARGDVVVPTFTHLASYMLVMAPLAYALAIPTKLGLSGILWAVILASYLSAGLLLARFWMLTRRD